MNESIELRAQILEDVHTNYVDYQRLLAEGKPIPRAWLADKARTAISVLKDWMEEMEAEDDTTYSVDHDAYYSKARNEWIDPKCDDPSCEFCTTRPKFPNQV